MSPRQAALEFGALAVRTLAGMPRDVQRIEIDVAKLRAWLGRMPADLLARVTATDDMLRASLGYEDFVFTIVTACEDADSRAEIPWIAQQRTQAQLEETGRQMKITEKMLRALIDDE